MRIYISMEQMIVSKRKLTRVCLGRYQHGVFDTGQSMQFNKDEVSKEAEELGRSRRKKPTMKGIEYKIFLMKERRNKVYVRLIRRCAVIDDLF